MEANKTAFKPFTVEDFDAFITTAEIGDTIYEFIGGELVEMPSNPYSSKIASRLNRYIGAHVDDNNLGHVTGEAGLYQIFDERYAPDVAYVSLARQAEVAKKGANPLPPDLAVEVISPSDSVKNISTKISNYLAAGTVVWAVYPDEKEVVIHTPGQPAQTLTEKDTLEGGSVLPGFSVTLNLIFKVIGESRQDK